MNKDWNSVKKTGLPELEEVSTTNFSSVYKSKEVLIQTKEASDLWHIVEKKCTRIRKGKMKFIGLYMEQAEEK